MNRFASRECTDAAASTWVVSFSSAQVTAASMSILPMPRRRYFGSTCRCETWIALSQWIGESRARVRCAAATTSSSRTATSSRSSGSAAIRATAQEASSAGGRPVSVAVRREKSAHTASSASASSGAASRTCAG
jgi:uncharacterized protein with von Willebrand factor type A (vWA) domain